MISGSLFAFLSALAFTGGQLEARVIRSEDLMAGPSLLGNHPSEAPLSVDGVVSDSGLDAAKVINQPMHEVNIDQHNAFALPLADALAFCGAINELTLLRRQAFETLEAQGVSHREAVEVLNDPEVKKQLAAMAENKDKLQKEALEIQNKFDQAKQEAAQPIQEADEPLDDSDPRSLAYQIVLNQEQAAKEAFVKRAEEEYRRELCAIEALPIAVCGRATPEFLRVTARQKFLETTVAWGCQHVPFYQHFHEVLEGEFLKAAEGAAAEAAPYLVPYGKVRQFLSKAVAKPIVKMLERQALRHGAKIVDKLPGLFKNPDVMKRGLEYEDYVAKSVPGRLKPNHPTFDFFNKDTGLATSVKSLDTQTAARIADPKQIYKQLRKHINKAVNYTGKRGTVLPDEVLSKELRVGVPIETGPSQWQQIQRAIEYAKSNGVDVIIEALK